jgi:hypothetical protein
MEEALDRERRELIHAYEKRLQKYLMATQKWTTTWPDLEKTLIGLPLSQTHALIVKKAEGLLPYKPGEAGT